MTKLIKNLLNKPISEWTDLEHDEFLEYSDSSNNKTVKIFREVLDVYNQTNKFLGRN